MPSTISNTYYCLCPVGTHGTYCENTINVCLSNPCGDNGVCVQPGINQYNWFVF